MSLSPLSAFNQLAIVGRVHIYAVSLRLTYSRMSASDTALLPIHPASSDSRRHVHLQVVIP